MHRYMVITRNSVYCLVPMPRTGGLMATGGILGSIQMPYTSASLIWGSSPGSFRLLLQGGQDPRRGPGWIETSTVRSIIEQDRDGVFQLVKESEWEHLVLQCPAPIQTYAISSGSMRRAVTTG